MRQKFHSYRLVLLVALFVRYSLSDDVIIRQLLHPAAADIHCQPEFKCFIRDEYPKMCLFISKVPPTAGTIDCDTLGV